MTRISNASLTAVKLKFGVRLSKAALSRLLEKKIDDLDLKDLLTLKHIFGVDNAITGPLRNEVVDMLHARGVYEGADLLENPDATTALVSLLKARRRTADLANG